MNEVFKTVRKAITGAVVAATIAWSVSLSAFLAPLAAQAAMSGSLVKASLPAVYYVGQDGKRYVFPNEKTYKTWYADFSGVVTITDSELAAMPIGGNVTYKPGVKMVKITTDPKVYVVDAHGTLRWVNSEATAVALYGSNWNMMIEDVSDAFFTNYSMGSDITSAAMFSPAAASAAATSINMDKNLGSSTTVSGSLTAMLSAGQSAGGTLPKGSMSVNVLKFDVRNSGSSAVTLNALTVHRSGAGVVADIAAAYVYAGNSRLTTGRTFNSTTHDATFSGLNLSVASGETKTLWIAVDFATTATGSNVHAFSVVSLSSGTVLASGLPLSGPTYTLTAASAGTLVVERSGSQPLSNVKAGQLMAKIGEFKLTAGSTEDVSFVRIALYRGGAVSRQYVSNLVLKQAGLTIATATTFDEKDRATFALSNPMLLEKGSSKTFEVYADIGAGSRTGATETILTYLDQNTDLLAVGSTYGFGVQVTSAGGTGYDGAGCALGAGNCSTTRIEGGQLTDTFNGPSSKDIAVNGKDIELYNFTMAAQSNLEIRNLRMQIVAGNVAGAADGLVDTSGTAIANYSDIKVVDTATGAVVAGPLELSTTPGDTTQALTYTEIFNLSAGTARTFKVTADVRNNTAVAFANDTVRIDLLAFTTNDVRNLDNSTYVALTDIVPNTTVAGNAHNVKAPSLVLGVASSPVAQTYIQGTQGAALAGFTFKAGDASDMRVNSVTITGEIDTNNGTATCTVAKDGTFAVGQENAACSSVASEVLSAKLWNGATQVGTTKSPSTGTGGTLTFDNLNLMVPKGQTVTLSLSGNLASALSDLTDALKFRVAANSDVSVTDNDGNTVTASGAGTYSAIMTVSGAGTISVIKASDDTESEAGLVVGGSSNVVLGKYKFSAVNEDLKLTKARIHVATANTVSSLSLYDGASLVGGPVSVDGSGNADFSGMSAFVIPKDGNKTLTVKGNLNTVGSSGATSGASALVTLCDGDNDGTCSGGAGDDTGTFEVRGTSAGSSTVIATAVNDVDANAKIVRRTKPTVSLVALPTTTLVAGQNVALRFTVSADAAGDVSLKGLVASVTNSTGGTLTEVSIGDSSIRRVGDASNLAGTSAFTVACTTNTTCVLVMQFGTEETITAGTSRTYEIRVSAATAAATNSISTMLLGDTTLASGLMTAGTPPTKISVGGTASNFVWSDNSASSHSFTVSGPSSTDWANGTYVKVLPTDSQTISK